MKIIDGMGQTKIKEAEKDCKEGAAQVMGLVKVLINKYLPKLNLHMPTWEYFKYEIEIEYQHEGVALGFGIHDINLDNLLNDLEVLNYVFGNNRM